MLCLFRVAEKDLIWQPAKAFGEVFRKLAEQKGSRIEDRLPVPKTQVRTQLFPKGLQLPACEGIS